MFLLVADCFSLLSLSRVVCTCFEYVYRDSYGALTISKIQINYLFVFARRACVLALTLTVPSILFIFNFPENKKKQQQQT